jgi:phage protein D
METVTRAELTVLIRGRDVTSDLTPYILSASYEDAVAGEADSLTLTVADPDARFLNSWYPDKGDTLEMLLGYPGDYVPSGLFEIDQVDVNGPPRAISIKAISAGITKKLRTRRSFAHEGSDLRKIANTIAGRHGLSVEGEINEGLKVTRSTQYRETDLGYLSRMAKEYGYVFSVRGSRLVFTNIYTLESRPEVTTIDVAGLLSYAFADKTTETYGAATVRYHNPDTQQYTEYVKENEAATSTEADTVEVFTVAKEPATAEAKARAALHDKTTHKVTGTISLPGRPAILSGNNVELTGLGVFDGIYHVERCSHIYDVGGGYTTSAELKKIR